MATGWSSSKKENANFARLCRLLVDGGTHVLRDIFDSIHPPSSLHSVLHSPAVHNTLQGLRRRKVLTRHQWDRLYPRIGTTVTSAGFDITLLFVLLRNTCGLNPPPTGWDNPPASSDKSKEADLVRLKLYRNELYGHITETAVSDSAFEKNWREISDVLVRLGGPRYKPNIERLKVETMDFEDEKYFIKTLEEWEETEKDLNMAIKKSERVMDRSEEMVEKISDRTADSTPEAGGKTYASDTESTSVKSEDKDVCTRVQDSDVMISSRPGEAEAVGEITFDATVEITGFSPPQVMKYVENYFQENENLKNAVLDHIKANDFLVSFCENRVMCFLMCCYMEWHVTESRTATTLPVKRTNLYHEVIKVFIKKHHGDSKYREMTETEIQETLLKLAELAFNLTREKKYIFEEEDMKKLNLSERQITNLKASGLIDCCPGVKTSPFEEPTLRFVFIHRTIQEYLCAVRCVKTKQIPDEEGTSGITLIFMAGLLSRNKNENFMKKLVEKIEPRGYKNNKNKLLVLNVLYEYGDVELSKPIIDNLYRNCFIGNEVMEFSGVTSYLDCVGISYFLDIIKPSKTHLTSPKHLRNTFIIGNSSLSSSGVQKLCQSLANHHNITTLKLLGCKLDDKCVNVIAMHLLSTNITHLELHGNNITDVGVKCICEVLIEANCCVEELDLRSNRKITDKCKEYRNVVQEQKPGVKLNFDDRISCGDRKEKEDTKNERTDKTVPPEILARGSEALRAYNEALENGKEKNRRVLVTVVGPARAGKTSLLRTLKGEKYNPEEDSTIGVQLQQAFCKPKESWCEEDGTKGVSYEKCIAEIMVKILSTQTTEKEPAVEIPATNNQSQQHISGESQQHSHTGESQHHSEDPVQKENEKVTNENKTKQKPENVRKNSELPKEIKKELISHMNSKPTNIENTDKNDIFLKTLDFAGQSVYNVIHPLFMSPKAIYILVHNLENNLLAQVQSKVKHCNSEKELENPFQMTNLDILEFWLSCISLYTNLDEDSVDETETALPPVYVACTHADLYKPVPKQDTEKLYKSLTRPENPSGKHVVPNIYTVDNTLSGNKKVNDESAKKLKADIEEKAKSLPQTNEDIPLTWLWFEDELTTLVQKEQKKYIDLEEATRIATKCRVNTESNDFTTLLNYLHDLKTIIYFQETRKVFIDTQWLVNMFVKVITVMPFGEWKDYADSWRKLEDEGVLQRDLVEHVWRDIVDDRQNTVDSMLLIMEKFSLVCPWKLHGQDVNLVPSMVCKSKTREEIDELLLDQKSSTMAVCFNSLHLPLGIFPRLFFAIAEFCKKEWPVKESIQLFQNFCRMYNVGKEGRFDLCIASDIRTIYVTVYNSSKVDGKLVTDFCQSVRELLDQIFKDMRNNFPWMKNMKFEYGIRCPICTKSSNECEAHENKGCKRDSCLHFVEGESLNDDRPRCYKAGTTPDNFIKEGTYSHWFPKKHVPVTSSLSLSDDQKRSTVIGICLNKTLLPALRDFAKTEITKHYTHLKTTQNIDQQSHKKHLLKDEKSNFNYASINNNEANYGKKKVPLYDYNVKTAVDLAKLYLQPFMAKFTGFDDTCDLSAVLGILSSASVFSSDVQRWARKVRLVRNEWAHCSFQEWDKTKFTSCFELMNSLLKALKLPLNEENRMSDELSDWKNKGVELCMGNISDADGLLQFIENGEEEINRLFQEVKILESSQKEEFERITTALQNIRDTLKKDKEEINMRIKSLEQKVKCHDKDVENLKQPKN